MNPIKAEAMHEAQQDAQAAYDEALDDIVAAIEADPSRVAQALTDYGMGEGIEFMLTYLHSESAYFQGVGKSRLNRVVRDAACEAARVELENRSKEHE